MAVIEVLLALMGCDFVDGRQASHAILEEKDPKAKLKKLTLSELRPGMLVLHIDEGRKIHDTRRGQQGIVAVCMSPLFATTAAGDQNRACDAVLIREREDAECDIVYIDLKSDRPAHFKGQFQSTRCFMRYLAELLRDLHNVPMQISHE